MCNRELLDVKLDDSRLGLEVSGLVSNANYNVKRATFLLFINSQCDVCLSHCSYDFKLEGEGLQCDVFLSHCSYDFKLEGGLQLSQH